MKDLTQGNEYKLIINFAIPMLIGNIFQQFYNIVDSIIVGQFIGKNALAAIGTSFPIFFLLVSAVIGIGMGATVVLSQYFGAKDYENVRKTVETTYIFIIVLSILLTALGLAFDKAVLKFLKTPPEILPQALIYLNTIIGGSIFLFSYNMLAALLRGLGDSKSPLYYLIISTITNIILDLIFILIFHWGVFGAAFATVISQAVAFFIGMVHIKRKNISFLLIGSIKKIKFHSKIFKLSFKIGLPGAIQHIFISAGVMALLKIINKFGPDAVAAFTIGGRIDSFSFLPGFSISASIATFAGQNLGAGKIKRAIKGLKFSILIISGLSILITILVFLLQKYLILIFNKDPRVIDFGTKYISVVALFYIIVNNMFIFNGFLRGAGATVVPMISSFLGLWIVRIPFAIYFSDKMGIIGIWWAIPTAWTAGLITSAIYFFTYKWKYKIITRQ